MSARRVIDGVTVVHAEQQGSTTANLMFRVGQGDETLPERGITHLVEHLALFPLGIRDHHANGQTGLHVTNFHASGTPTEITSFLTSVCEALGDLPVERLGPEKLVLRTEESQRSSWTFSDLATWRFGATSDGVASFAELGRDQVTADQLLAWRDRHFTRGNAVLLIIGPSVPAGLSLPLPPGDRQPVPPLEALIPRGRSCFAAGKGAVLFEIIVERTTEATLVAQILNRLMYQQLRLDAPYSYTVGCGYEPRDATHAMIRGYADALDEQVDAMIGATIDLLAQVRRGRFDDSVVTETVASRLEGLDSSEVTIGRSASEAFDLLVGAEPLTTDAYRDRLRAMEPDVVRAAAARILDETLVQVPFGRHADWGGFDPLPVSSERRVQATAVHRLLDDSGAVHVASTGLTRIIDGSMTTVFYDSCAACLAWPDGLRTLIGQDGFVLGVEPHLLENGEAVVAHIDAHMDPARVIPRPARAPEDIPEAPPQHVPASGGWLRRRRKQD